MHNVLPTASSPSTKLVTKVEDITEIVDLFSNDSLHQPFMFLDLEGVNLSRRGNISLLQLLVPPNPRVYIIDVLELGETAFSRTNKQGWSLGSILRSPEIAKVFFDVRMDSDALFAHFGIALQGVIDVQLLEFATRSKPYKKLNGLRRCIETEGKANKLPMYTESILQKKDEGAKLFKKKEGGSHDVFMRRPLPQAILVYCQVDVLMLPGLLEIYGRKLAGRSGLARRIQTATEMRIFSSQAPDFEKGKHAADGPKELMKSKVKTNDDTQIVFPMKTVLKPAKLRKACMLGTTQE